MDERSANETRRSLHLQQPSQTLAYIEDSCIGCTLCIRACPEAAIVGELKKIHTVINSLCTGCELCLAPCPVDCIRMKSLENGLTYAAADLLAEKHHNKSIEEKPALQNKSKETIHKAILAATERARQKRLTLPKKSTIQNQSGSA